MNELLILSVMATTNFFLLIRYKKLGIAFFLILSIISCFLVSFSSDFYYIIGKLGIFHLVSMSITISITALLAIENNFKISLHAFAIIIYLIVFALIDIPVLIWT